VLYKAAEVRAETQTAILDAHKVLQEFKEAELRHRWLIARVSASRLLRGP
jgi:hypothetical protein